MTQSDFTVNEKNSSVRTSEINLIGKLVSNITELYLSNTKDANIDYKYIPDSSENYAISHEPNLQHFSEIMTHKMTKMLWNLWL